MTKRKRYDDEFRASAVLMLEAAGYRVSATGGAILYGFFVEGDKTPFYIGSTRSSLEHRIASHNAQVKTGTHANKHFLNKCRKHGSEHVYCVSIAAVSEPDQFFAERDLIQWTLGNGVRLTNKIYNGINVEIDERYTDPPPLSPEKFWLGYRITREPPGECIYPEMQGIYERLHEHLKQTIDLILRKFPDEAREQFGTDGYRPTNR